MPCGPVDIHLHIKQWPTRAEMACPRLWVSRHRCPTGAGGGGYLRTPERGPEEQDMVKSADKDQISPSASPRVCSQSGAPGVSRGRPRNVT
jgi:hypothetical protein